MTSERWVSLTFTISMLASGALVVVYLSGGQAQWEGILLAVALGAMGAGVSVWAVTLLPGDEVTEEREVLASPTSQRRAVEEAADRGGLTRRKMLVRLLAGAGTTLLGALAIPALSLGPRPGQSLFTTAWKPGLRLVDADGAPVRAASLPMGSVTTVFPEGSVGSADSQTLVIKVADGELEMDEERVGWAPEGCVGYSKICTHAGCPVGLYRAESHELLCPCHQSTFNVLRGAEPTFGPADRPLPQLPMDIDEEGYLIAKSDFTEPVGPGFWNLTSGEDD
ncbi:MAG: Rieske 2Fe-2S domain-containing protein [Actinomycetota bacterium]